MAYFPTLLVPPFTRKGKADFAGFDGSGMFRRWNMAWIAVAMGRGMTAASWFETDSGIGNTKLASIARYSAKAPRGGSTAVPWTKPATRWPFFQWLLLLS